jgi:hypothetical protein
MRKIIKGLVLCSFVFSLIIISLALIPHYTCGCGQFNDSSQLTHIINTVSEDAIGKPLLPKRENPYK